MASSPEWPGSPVGRGVARRVQFTAESSIGLVVVRFRVERKRTAKERHRPPCPWR